MLVAMLQCCGQRGRLTTSRRSHHQNQPLSQQGQILKDQRQFQVSNARQGGLNIPHHQCDLSPLAKGRETKASDLRHDVGIINLPSLPKLIAFTLIETLIDGPGNFVS